MPQAGENGLSLPYVANVVRQPAGDMNPLKRLGHEEGGTSTAESRKQFLTRATAYLKEAKVPEVAASLFTAFQDTNDLRLLLAAFARLSSLAMEGEDQEVQCSATSWDSEMFAMHAPHEFPYIRIRRLLGNSWKAKQLWKTLDQRASRAEYTSSPCGGGRLAGKCCLVVGAGPCGLRAAVELLLLGARVTVVERDSVFSRINQLSLMRWCGEDLKGLGAAANSFSPSPGSLYAATDRLQLLLLRTALLLGAEIYMGMSFERLSWVDGSWWAMLRPQRGKSEASGERDSFPPSQKAPPSIPGLAAIICAAGAGTTATAMLGCSLGNDLAWEPPSRWEPVLGLVCNVAKTRTGSEVRSFALARPFATSALLRAMEQTGVDLESVVHVNAPMAHFFLMMPSLRSLAAAGVIIDETAQPLLAPQNINAARLDELARRVLAHRFNDDPNVLEAPDDPSFPGYADNGPKLFEMRRSEQRPEGLQFLHPPSRSSDDMGSGADWSVTEESDPEHDEESQNLLVAHVGDALIEPFWPEGLGLLRGFFGALDACSAIRQWAIGATCAATQEAHQQAFQQLKAVHLSTKARILHDDERRYALAPETRYRKF